MGYHLGQSLVHHLILAQFDHFLFQIHRVAVQVAHRIGRADHPGLHQLQGHKIAPIAMRTVGDGQRAGPLIIEEYDATCVVPPDWTAALDGDGNIILTREAA